MSSPKGIMPLSFFAHMVNDGSELLLPTLLPLIVRDFNLSYSQIGVLGGAMIVAIGFGQMFMGYLSDVTGKRTTLVSFGLLLLSGSLYGVSRATSYGELIFFNLVAGIGASIYHPIGISTLSRMFKGDRKGRALGIHGAGGNMGLCVFPLIAGVLADCVGWRIVFAVFPIFTAVMSLLFFVILKEYTEKSQKLQLKLILNSRLLLIALSLGFISMAARGMAVFFPIRLDSMGYSSSNIGFMFSLLFGTGIFGQYAGGYLSDKYSKKAMITCLSLVSSTLLFIPFFIRSFQLMMIVMLVAGFAKDSIWPPLFNISTENAPERSYGTALGIFFSIGYIMSSQASVIMGVVWDHFSFMASVAVLLIFGIASALSIQRV